MNYLTLPSSGNKFSGSRHYVLSRIRLTYRLSYTISIVKNAISENKFFEFLAEMEIL